MVTKQKVSQRVSQKVVVNVGNVKKKRERKRRAKTKNLVVGSKGSGGYIQAPSIIHHHSTNTIPAQAPQPTQTFDVNTFMMMKNLLHGPTVSGSLDNEPKPDNSLGRQQTYKELVESKNQVVIHGVNDDTDNDFVDVKPISKEQISSSSSSSSSAAAAAAAGSDPSIEFKTFTPLPRPDFQEGTPQRVKTPTVKEPRQGYKYSLNTNGVPICPVCGVAYKSMSVHLKSKHPEYQNVGRIRG